MGNTLKPPRTYHGDELRTQASSVGMHQRAYLERGADKIDELTQTVVRQRSEIERYQNREQIIINALKATDNGLYVNDIVSSISLLKKGHITQEALKVAVEHVAKFLPGFDRREQYKLCAGLFQALGLTVEGW